jgi:hypothetical protein
MPRKPVEQEYESKHQNLLAQQERRLQDAWRNVVVVFPDTGVFLLLAHCEHKELFLLRPGEESEWCRGLVSFADYFNHGDGAVRGTLCFSLPYSREITHFPTPVLLSAARSNSTVNDTSSNHKALWCCLA